ncbi:MAG: acyl-CoA dehydrogenase family protein [Candidatus Hermodarchaeota archaeon]
MEFSLTEKQKMLKKITRQFAEEYIVPVARESDEKQELDDTVYQKMKEMNYFGTCIPEEYGGAGLHNDTIGFGIVIEEISRADAAWGITIAVHNGVAAYPIYSAIKCECHSCNSCYS